MNPDFIRGALASGRFTDATINYWVEWLVARNVTPPDLDSFIEFIAVMESDVSYGLNELIPKEWYPHAP